MLLTVSLALLLGIAAFATVRYGRVGAGSAAVLWLSGFTVASTGLAPYVNHALTAVTHALLSIH
ncbi:hypothetical protein [Streptacidiphilus neutrinimicus]|uniref:hypothetical protein n=1 Tax=Streptacidiphilus neutrinimicus TaxID=105420 RepID=UPI0005A84536|nr:hypothetical protein [Streptacidiphilus neutrinimicus]